MDCMLHVITVNTGTGLRFGIVIYKVGNWQSWTDLGKRSLGWTEGFKFFYLAITTQTILWYLCSIYELTSLKTTRAKFSRFKESILVPCSMITWPVGWWRITWPVDPSSDCSILPVSSTAAISYRGDLARQESKEWWKWLKLQFVRDFNRISDMLAPGEWGDVSPMPRHNVLRDMECQWSNVGTGVAVWEKDNRKQGCK